jgi:hypothetical protein
VASNPFLSGELLPDQFTRDAQGSAGRVGEGLSTTELGIRGTNWARRCEHRPVAFQHHEAGILVGEPAERGKRNHSVRADHN